MTNKSIAIQTNAARVTASTFGALGGLGGIIHGIGETLQGSVEPGGVFFSSWAEGPIAIYLDGDPALSLIPNMLITGIITLIISLIIIIYSVGIVIRKCHGKLLIAFSIIMLTVGGGVGPPVLTFLAGITALGNNGTYSIWRKFMHSNILSIFAILWPWVFTVSALNGVFLVIGHVIAVYFFAPVSAEIFLNSFLFAVISVVLSKITGIAYDITRSKQNG